MSGSDFGGGRNIGGGMPKGGGTACEALGFETNLSSPKPQIVNRLNVGSKLDIKVEQSNGVEVVVAMHNSDVVGGLVYGSERLKPCIDKGYTYTAEVRELRGSLVTVFVSAD